MTADLEQELRATLRRRADGVTPATLVYGDAPRSVAASGPRRPASWWWLAPAAAVAVLIVAVVAVVARNGGSGGAPAANGTRAATVALAGTGWDLVTVGTASGKTVEVPARVQAYIVFERDGRRTEGDDGVNQLSARYTVDQRGDLVLGPATSTAVGYAGRDPAKLAAIAGVDAVVGSGGVVRVDVDDQQLRLTAGGYTLIFTSGAPPATSAAAPGHGTATP